MGTVLDLTDAISLSHEMGETTARFHWNEHGGVGLQLFPTALAPKVVSVDRPHDIDSILQIKILGDEYGGRFAQGRTLRGSPSVKRFKHESQRVLEDCRSRVILTTLRSTESYEVEHRLIWRKCDETFEVSTSFLNGSEHPVTLEMLSSFSLGGITPFHESDAPGRLRVHRFRSAWSAEGRLETQSIEQLHLERSWSGSGLFSERFGQVGSMPVRGWFPFVAVEDLEAGVLWGAQISWAGSWQIEVSRQYDRLCISGGLADREFGHWTKTLAPGESLVTPPAQLACVVGDLEELCSRMVAAQESAADRQPLVERDLPIVFNEWCTTWGDPSHDRMLKLADRLRGSQTKYLVIDAGWYKGDDSDWGDSHGDWTPNSKQFPGGLEATALAIREAGLIPGLWFEMETCGCRSAAFSLVDHLLKRDGAPITVGSRRFWDLNDAFAADYLSDKVIALLQRCDFGYLKVDYNETIGIGCDGCESQGEGLRRQIDGVHRFFDRIRETMPDLVIESCASGGHRLEPSMVSRTAMSSFSDAHELVEIPIIAANLQRLVPPRQSQIWAVLHRSDSDRRLVYSLAATFLGRMCLSGDIDGLKPEQWALLYRAQRLYQLVAPIIRRGKSRRFGVQGESWRHPSGWQGVVRTAEDGQTALVVVHGFSQGPEQIELPLPGTGWSIVEEFSAGTSNARIVSDALAMPLKDLCAAVFLLERGGGSSL